MKKPIVVLVVIIAFIGVVACINFLTFVAHREIIENAHSYEPTSILSSDERFILKTERIEDESRIYVSFSVLLNAKEIYRCPDKYRTMDLKSIDWDSDSYNVIVQSGDVGTIVYYYQNNNWGKVNPEQ
jgi:hypothetical protein